ncbi:hypothetical protein LM700514_60254 [Listeria monocytogenes]|nr:hypothetical protein LM700514_60254 [Listeria monocytogenes]
MGYSFQAILTKIFTASPFLVERASHHHKLAYIEYYTISFEGKKV